MSGPLPLIDTTRSLHQVSCLQLVHVSRVLRLERVCENREKGICTSGSGPKGVAFSSLVLRVDGEKRDVFDRVR